MDEVLISNRSEGGTGQEKQSLSSLSYQQLEALLQEMGQPAYRAAQLFTWVHQKQVSSIEEMTNLPAALRKGLAARYRVDMPRVVQVQQSRDETKKYLFELADGNCVETVLMQYRYGNSLCVSSQVGCRMGCRFCASTKGGLVRNLTAGEMLGQVYGAQKESGLSVSHVVLMGIGEPLDNFDNVLTFVRMVMDERGQNLSGRNISLSTCGLIGPMDRLAACGLPLTLSVSLHAADDETRRSLMPVAHDSTVQELLAACRRYRQKTGRRVSFEYAVVPGVNDRDCDAKQLSQQLRGLGAHVNLIAVNPVGSALFEKPNRQAAACFQKKITALGLHATVRRSLGTDIAAACGQLRAEHQGKKEEQDETEND